MVICTVELQLNDDIAGVYLILEVCGHGQDRAHEIEGLPIDDRRIPKNHYFDTTEIGETDLLTVNPKTLPAPPSWHQYRNLGSEYKGRVLQSCSAKWSLPLRSHC